MLTRLMTEASMKSKSYEKYWYIEITTFLVYNQAIRVVGHKIQKLFLKIGTNKIYKNQTDIS